MIGQVSINGAQLEDMTRVLKKFSSPLIYTSGSIINAAFAFISSVYIARNVSIGDYGMMTNIITAISVIVPFLGFQLESAITVFYYKNRNEFSTFLSHVFYLFLGLFCFSTLFVATFYQKISQYYQLSNEVIWLCLGNVFCIILTAYLLTILNIKGRGKLYAKTTIIRALLDVSLSILFIKILCDKVFARILAYFVSNCITTIILFISVKGIFYFEKLSFLTVNILVRFAGPLVVHTLVGVLLSAVDRYYLTKFEGLENVGIYTVAFQVASVFSLISSALNLAWVPWFNGILSNFTEENKEVLRYRIILLVALLVIGFVSLCLISPLLLNVFYGEKFTGAGPYITLILLGFLFQSIYYIFVNFLLYQKKTFLLMRIDLFLLVIKCLTSYVCIDSFGTIGAAISYTFTFGVYVLIVSFFSSRLYRMRYFVNFNFRRMVKEI